MQESRVGPVTVEEVRHGAHEVKYVLTDNDYLVVDGVLAPSQVPLASPPRRLCLFWPAACLQEPACGCRPEVDDGVWRVACGVWRVAYRAPWRARLSCFPSRRFIGCASCRSRRWPRRSSASSRSLPPIPLAPS